MVKPIDEEELVLRVKALLRRAKIVSERKINIGPVTLNYDTMTVSRGTERSTLPQKEFLLLYKLLSYPGMIFTRMQLMDEIWGVDTESSDHTVSVHIGRLRERFHNWPEFTVETVRGLGYKAVRYDEE
jgi:DNA-binding response OmpR family regulator